MSYTFLRLEDPAGTWRVATVFVGKEYLIIPGTAVTREVNGTSQHGTGMEEHLGSPPPVALTEVVGVHEVLRGLFSSGAFDCSNYLGTI